jgi:hypothetical protein
MSNFEEIWNQFCVSQDILRNGQPLFECDSSLKVKTRKIGKTNYRTVLCRSQAMETMMISETDKLVADLAQQSFQYDGLIYMMYSLDQSNLIVPLYIGKTETVGKTPQKLSVNLENLHHDKSKFARWGDSYAYHIGDLSAAVLLDHSPDKINHNYRVWASSLFVTTPTDNPTLKAPVFIWAKAWGHEDVGIGKQHGSTHLLSLKDSMIGVASVVFPTILLNRQGQNRAFE